MDIRIRAALETAKVLGFAGVAAVGTMLALHFMTAEVFSYILGAGLVIGAIYVCYTSNLSYLRFREATGKTVDSK